MKLFCLILEVLGQCIPRQDTSYLTDRQKTNKHRRKHNLHGGGNKVSRCYRTVLEPCTRNCGEFVFWNYLRSNSEKKSCDVKAKFGMPNSFQQREDIAGSAAGAQEAGCRATLVFVCVPRSHGRTSSLT